MADSSERKLPFLSRFGRSSDNGPSKTTKSSAGASTGLSSSVGRSGTEDVLDIHRGREPQFRQNNAPIVPETPESSLIAVIIREGIAAKLPHTAGALSNESEARLNAAGIALHQFPLSAVLVPLLNQLESLTRPPYFNPDVDYVSVDLLKSQLLLLRTIADCTTQYWANVATSSTTFLDPVPLDDQIANRLLLLSLMFFNLPTEDAIGLSSRSSSIAMISQAALKSATQSNKGNPTPSPAPATRQLVSQEIARQAGRIAYFLSASNWPVVFGRIKHRISQYANEDSSDLLEMRLLEWCCLNRRRLSVVLQELCQTYIHLRKGAQASMSVVLRRAIWSWIESFSGEFQEMIVSGRRIEGGAEVLFDVIFTLSETSDKRKVFAWPVLTMLLCLLPDSLEKLVVGESGRASGMVKKFQFFENLRKSLKGTKLAEIALACYIDLCRAAAITKPGLESSLRLLVSDIDSDLKSKLLDPARPFSNSEGVPDVNLMADAHVALFHLDATSGSRTIAMALSSSGSTDVAKLAAISACVVLGENLETSTSLGGLAPSIRNLLVDYAPQTSDIDQNLGNGRRGSSRTSIRALPTDAHSTRAELLRSILMLWTARPELCAITSTSIDGDSSISTSTPSQLFDSLSILLSDSNLQGSACKVLLELCRLERSLGATSFGPTLSKAIRNYLADSARDRVGELDALNLFLCDVHSQLDLPDPAWTTLETSLLLSMCSYDPFVRTRSKECFEMIARLSPDSRRSESNKDNLVLLAVSAASQSVKPIDTWRAISSIREASYGLQAAFDEALRRWKLLLLVLSMRSDGDSEASSTVARRRDLEPRTPESQLSEFTQLTGFLTANAGACHQVEGRARTVERLVQELVDLLVSENPGVQSSVKDSLGSVFGVDAFPILFKQLHSIISRFIESDDTSSSADTSSIFSHFIGEALSLLTLQSDRLSGDLLKATSNLLDDLILACTRFVSRMGRSAAAARLKVDITRISASVLAGRSGRSDRDDLVFRNHLLEHVVNWYGQSKSGAADVFRRNVEESSLAALGPILDDLCVISLPEWTALKTPVSSYRLFNRYYDFFQTLLQSFPMINQASRNLAISAFASLVGANVGPARHRLVEMTLHPDISLRSANLEVISLVLEKGIRMNETSPPISEDLSPRLEDLLRSPDLTLAIAMSDVAAASSYEDLSDCFLKVLSGRMSLKLLKALLEREIMATENESSLLRANSFSTRMLTVFSRACGYGYLRATLHELIQSLCDSPEFTLDFDPHRVADDTAEGVAVIRRLEKIATAFLVKIEDSVDQVPKPIREICAHIGTTVGSIFPESVYTTIGGFMFLRFISPAIVSPDILNLDLPADNRDLRRGLVLITKVLQALANNVRFGIKEPGLRSLNDFCDSRIFGMTQYLAAISHYDPTEELQDDQEYKGNDLDDSERSVIHQFLLEHKEKIKAALLLPTDPTRRHWHDAEEIHPITLGATTSERLEKTLSTMDAVETEVAESDNYSEFMQLNGARPLNFELWNSVFYESKDTQNNVSTFCLSLEKIDVETADLESLIYFALSRIANAGSMELLIDATGFASRNQIPAQWLLRIVSLLPSSTLQSFQNIVIYNPNSNFRAYSRTIGRHVSLDGFDSRRVVSVTGIAELRRHIPGALNLLSTKSAHISREERSVFRNVTQLSDWKVEHPVVLEVGGDTLLITTIKKQQVISDVDGILCDILRLSDVIEIRRIAVGIDGEGISILCRGEAARQFLLQSRREECFQVISVAVGSVEMSLVAPSQSPFRPGETLPNLLNAIIVSLCSMDSQARRQAYSLLCALATSIALDGKEEYRQGAGLSVPSNHVTLVTAVSERFASTLLELSLPFIDNFSKHVGSVSSDGLATYLHALRPHLHNLYSLVYAERSKAAEITLKLKSFVGRLIVLSHRDIVGHTILQSRIWPAIGKIDFLVPLVLSEVVRIAMNLVSAGDDAGEDVSSQILSALGGGLSLRGKLLARLRQAIARTATSPRSTIDQSLESEISILLRLDSDLSFHANSPSLHLPEVFYIYATISATSPLSARILARQILDNTIHACFSESRTTGALRTSLARLPTPELAPASFDALVKSLLLVLAEAAPSLDQANVWRVRLSSLVASTAFQRSPLQSSSFVVLAALAVDMDNGDASYQILSLLRSSIRLGTPESRSLSISVIACLSKSIVDLVSDQEFFQGLFWTAISILQIGSPEISRATIGLLLAVVKALDAFNDGADTEGRLLQFRKMETERSSDLDELSGVNFDRFPFAIIQLCQFGPLDDLVEELLYLLARKSRSTPFFVFLFPSATKKGKVVELLDTIGFSNQALSAAIVESFIERIRLDDKDSIILTTALLARSLSTVKEEEGLSTMYMILSALLSEYPDVAAMFHDSILPIIHATLSSSTTSSTLFAAASTLFSHTHHSPPQNSTDIQTILARLGFPNILAPLPTSSSFDVQVTPAMQARGEIVSRIIAFSLQ